MMQTLRYAFVEYIGEPDDRLAYSKEKASYDAGGQLLKTLQPGEWYAVRVNEWHGYMVDQYRNNHQMSIDVQKAASERIIMPPKFEDMDWPRLSYSAIGEIKRRWRLRLSSWGRFFCWLERAQGWA